MAIQNILPTSAQISTGLTSDEAKKRLLQYGPNAVAEAEVASLAKISREILGPCSLDARSHYSSRNHPEETC